MCKGRIVNGKQVEDECCDCGGGCQDCAGCDNAIKREPTLEIFRNRSEMEACITMQNGTKYDRVPVRWKKRNGKLDYLSVSKIQSYEQCPACFYHEYLSEETAHVDNANYFTKFGSILHEVVEKVMRTYRDTGIILDTETVFNEAWKKYDLTGFDAYEEAKSLAVNYFKCNDPADRPERPVIIEEEWRGELGGCTFGMMIDYAGVKKSNESIGYLRDYKTNRMPFTNAELQSSLQLRIYQIILRRHFMPDVKRWISGYDLFYYGWQQCKEFTEDDLKTAEDYVANIYYQITNDTVWEEKLNSYCGYRECRHNCETYQKALKAGKVSNYKYVVNNEDMDWVALEHEREAMVALEKNAKNRKTELDGLMKAHIEDCASRGEKVIIDGKELMLYASSSPYFRYEDVYRVLLTENKLDLLNGFLTIKDAKAFARLCNAQDTNLRLQLAGCQSNGYSSPYITKKRG